MQPGQSAYQCHALKKGSRRIPFPQNPRFALRSMRFLVIFVSPICYVLELPICLIASGIYTGLLREVSMPDKTIVAISGISASEKGLFLS